MSTTNGTSSPATTTPTTVVVDKKAAREELQARREMEQESKKHLAMIKQHGRQLDLIKKEKDNLQQDYNKAILAK